MQRSNLGGIEISSLIVLTELDMNESDVKNLVGDEVYDPDVEVGNRLSVAIHLLLQQLCNFTTAYRKVAEWGYLQPNGTFSGMFGLLETNQCDLSVTVCGLFVDRMRVAKYLPVISSWDIHFLYRQNISFGGPKALSRPFHTLVWTGIFGVLFICALMFALFCKLSLKLEEQVVNDEAFYSHEERYSVGSGIFLLFGVITQQGIDEDSQKTSLRVLSLISFLFSFLIFTHYSSGILNGLLWKSPSTIVTFQDLIDSNLQLVVWNVPYTQIHLKKTDPIALQLRRKATKPRGSVQLVTMTEGIELTQTGKFAFLASPLAAYWKIQNKFSPSELCTFYTLTKRDYSMLTGLAVSKKSSIKEIAFNGVVRIKETGLETREKIRWFPAKPPCLVQQQFTSVSPESLFIAYIILIMGFVLSPFILAFELFLTKHKLFKSSDKNKV